MAANWVQNSQPERLAACKSRATFPPQENRPALVALVERKKCLREKNKRMLRIRILSDKKAPTVEVVPRRNCSSEFLYSSVSLAAAFAPNEAFLARRLFEAWKKIRKRTKKKKILDQTHNPNSSICKSRNLLIPQIAYLAIGVSGPSRVVLGEESEMSRTFLFGISFGRLGPPKTAWCTGFAAFFSTFGLIEGEIFSYFANFFEICTRSAFGTGKFHIAVWTTCI